MSRLRSALTLLTCLVLSAVQAQPLPDEASALLLTESGTVVGVGRASGGLLELLLEPGFDGRATLLITGTGKEVVALDVLVRRGQLLVVDDSGARSLAVMLRESGTELLVEVTQASELDVELPVEPRPEDREGEIAADEDDVPLDDLPSIGKPSLP